jgi:hypothetical protein
VPVIQAIAKSRALTLILVKKLVESAGLMIIFTTYMIDISFIEVGSNFEENVYLVVKLKRLTIGEFTVGSANMDLSEYVHTSILPSVIVALHE